MAAPASWRLRTIQVCSKDAGNDKPGVWRLGVEGMGRSYRPTAFVPTTDALRHGLQNLGYSEGRNITLDVRYTQGRSDLAAQFAAELVRSDVAVLHELLDRRPWEVDVFYVHAMKPSDDQDQGDWVGAAAARRALVAALQQQSG
jgi:hypothetical protein